MRLPAFAIVAVLLIGCGNGGSAAAPSPTSASPTPSPSANTLDHDCRAFVAALGPVGPAADGWLGGTWTGSETASAFGTAADAIEPIGTSTQFPKLRDALEQLVLTLRSYRVRLIEGDLDRRDDNDAAFFQGTLLGFIERAQKACLP